MPDEGGGRGGPTILITGMFDMPNFGDLMFPIVAAHELGLRGYRVQALSPTGASTGLADAMPSRPIWQAFDPDTACDGLLIGGGYILHTHRMDQLKEYRGAGIGAAVAPAVWLGATLAAALRDVPVAWNAPGAPHPLRPGIRPLAEAAFEAADYFSLRDEASARLAGTSAADLVPDPILTLPAVWPRSALAVDHLRLCGRLGIDRPDRVLAVHVRRRSLGGAPVNEIAPLIASVCRSLDVTPVFIGLGTAHADDRIARELAAGLVAQGIMAAALDRPERLRDIAALIAQSRAYVGSSMHGYVAAAAYGVPALLVARPAYRKFDGIVAHLRRPEALMTDWSRALAALQAAIAAGAPPLPPGIAQRLQRHWNRIATAYAGGPGTKRPARLAFAARAFASGLGQAGPDWAMLPFTTARDREAALHGIDVLEAEPF
jgi:polysaccharide pyruvyl transferase WcaK-like protein